MDKPLPPDYKFCPFCGDPLQIRMEEGHERKYCPNDKWTYYPHVASSAGGLAIRDGKVLLVQRAREPYKGTWMIPSGFCDFAEHPRDTVIRELPEETGYEVTQISYYTFVQSEDDPRQPFHNYFVYLVELGKQGKISDIEENTGVDWFDLNNLPPVGWKSHNEILANLAKTIAKR